MALDESLCFVQFLHPGGEHRPDTEQLKHWNTSMHQRKFLKVPGRYLAKGDERQANLLFWGEWEPESEVLEAIEEPLDDGPRFIWKPYYVRPPSYVGVQNTDPFVFGGFFYTGCQQNKVTGPTQLRFLAKGSVILFGSYKAARFVLDTVFVVRDWIDHDLSDYRGLRHRVPRTYWDVTVGPWYPGNDPERTARESYRLYRGATVDSSLGGMFSFFPCVPAADDSLGFARPSIDIKGVIRPRQRQGYTLNPQSHLDDVSDLWRAVVKQVEDQGLRLGTYAEMPERRPR